MTTDDALLRECHKAITAYRATVQLHTPEDWQLAELEATLNARLARQEVTQIKCNLCGVLDESMAVTDHNMRGLIKSTRKRLVLTHNVRARLILPPISKGI